MAGQRRVGGIAPLLGCLALVATDAAAQDGTWAGSSSGDLGSGGNWTPDNVPTGTATFGAAINTTPFMDRSLTFGTLSFEAGAPAYGITLNGGFGNDVALTLDGGGIANASDFAPGIILNPVSPSGAAQLILQNAASLGNATVSAGSGAGPTLLQLSGTATAGTATITGVPITLLGSATLGDATVINAPSLGLGGTATAGNATIGMAPGGVMTAGAGTSLGTARITLGGGGSALQVTGPVDGSTAQVNLTAGSTLSISGLSAAVPSFTLGTLSATGGTLATTSTGTVTILSVDGGALPIDITGSANLVFAGNEARVLTGNSDLSGTITLQGGSLTVGNGGTTGRIEGNVALAAGTTLGFNRADPLVYFGTVSGAGGLVKQGAGSLTLVAAHSFTGPTVIDGGSILLSDGGSLASSALTIGPAGTFDISNNPLTGSAVNGLSGSGVVRLGANQLAIRGGSGTFSGSLSDGGDAGGSGGSLLIDNGARLNLTGTGTYTGITTVRSGTLLVNGSLASPVSVEAGGVLGGNGTVGSTTVAGTISPGNSIGTINVAGNLVLQPGAVTVMEVQGSAADRINVTGTAQLAGTLRLVPIGSSFTFNTPFVLVNAAGGRTGAFGSVITTGSFGPGVNPEIALTSTGVTLVLQAQSLTPSLAPDTPTNVVNVINALDTRTGDASPFFPVLNAPASQTRAAGNQLTGEVGTAPAAITQQAAAQFLATMLDGARLRRGSYSSDQPYSVWVAALGGYGRTTGEGSVGSATRQTRNAGSAVGTDMRLGAGTTLGFAFAGGQGEARLDGGLGRASGEVAQGGIFGSHWFGPLFLGFAGSHTRMQADTSRSIAVLNSAARAETVPQTWSTRIEAAYELTKIGAFTPIPAFAYQGHWTRSDGYAERVSGPATAAGLSVQPNSQATTRTETGLGGEYEVGQSDLLGRSLGLNLRLVGRLAWAHYIDREAGMLSNFEGERSTSFITNGARPGRNAALVGAGMEATLADRFTLHARMEGEFSSSVTSVGGTARLRYEF